MRSFIGPAAHHGSNPTKNLRVPGVTSRGDGAEPAGSRPLREIIVGAMVLIVALAALADWALLKPASEVDSASLGGGIYFDIVETLAVSAPADGSTWKRKIAGVMAYAEAEPPIRVLINARARSWIVTSGTPAIYLDDGTARNVWNVTRDPTGRLAQAART